MGNMKQETKTMMRASSSKHLNSQVTSSRSAPTQPCLTRRCLPAAVDASFARMSDETKAKCYALRNPPQKKGEKVKKMRYADIAMLVKKTDKTHPTPNAVQQAVKGFKTGKKPAGRPQGSRATTKDEDKVILQTFKKLCPPGHGVDKRKIHKALPQKIKKKIGSRTVALRLGEKGIKARNKLSKSRVSNSLAKKRLAFCKSHEDKTVSDWKHTLQAVADLKEFTWYPRDLRSRFKQLRAPWTYMTEAEQKKPDFLRPKRWFARKEWKRVRKQKVFGLVTSTGKKLAVPCPTPMNAASFATLVRTKISPFLKRHFPRKQSVQILLDGEKIFHSPPAKAALREKHITILPKWPAHSPDLNPVENVWPHAERRLREIEKDNDTFEVFSQRCVDAIMSYPSDAGLVQSMPKRMEECVARNGAMIFK